MRLGLRTLDAVEVLEGLAAGDRVLLRGDRRARRTGARGRGAMAARASPRPPRATAEDPGSTLGNAFGR